MSKSSEYTNEVMIAYKNLLKGPNGSVVKKDLQYYANRQSHVKDSPTESAFRDGQRIFARNILIAAGELEDGEDDRLGFLK